MLRHTFSVLSINISLFQLESLVKSAKDTERRRRDDGYSWLKSKSFEKDNLFVNDAVADLKPMLDKVRCT